MRQLVIAVLISVVVVAFAMVNSQPVQVNYIFGEPIRIRLIFLLAIAFIGGIVTAGFYGLLSRYRKTKNTKVRPETRQVLRQVPDIKNELQRDVNDDLDDVIFESRAGR